MRESAEGKSIDKRLGLLLEKSKKEDSNGGFERLAKWLDGTKAQNNGIRIKDMFEAVLQQVLIGDATSITDCVSSWGVADDFWNARPAKDLNAVMRGKLLEQDEDGNGWLVTEAGAELGLIQAFYIDADGTTSSYAVYSKAAQ